MKKVKTIWNYSWETEVDRIIQASVNTANRFYLKYGFLVLPRLVKGNGRTVYLPELEFGKIPDYWPKVAKLSLDNIPVLPEASRGKPVLSIKKLLLEKRFELEKEKAEKLRKVWEEKEQKFWQILFELFPFLAEKEVSLEVRPTSLGTMSSFNFVDLKKKELSIKVILRTDFSVGHLVEGIISSLLWKKLEGQGYDWEEREASFDAFLKFTKLTKLFPDYQPTLEQIRTKENGGLFEESQKYLQRLGISSREIFSIKNNRLLIDQKLPLVGLSCEEEKILRFLTGNKSRLCSAEQIAEAVWQEKTNEKFSLWAVTKAVCRLRKKLQINGVSPTVIQTQRGRGYLLID